MEWKENWKRQKIFIRFKIVNKSIKNKLNEFFEDKESRFLFLHIREPKEIQRAAKEFNAKTILIVRDTIKHITSNMADENVFNYEYDYIIENNGTKEELNNKVKDFVKGETVNEA